MRRVEDLETLTETEKQMLREVKRAVLERVPEAEVILYGSAARGERRPDSDYDVLVLVERRLTRAEEDEIIDAVYDVQVGYGAIVVSIIYARSEWDSGLVSVSPYKKNVEREAAAL